LAHRRASAAALVAATGGGVGAVFDPMGGKGLSRTRRALKPGGMRVAFGFLNAILGPGGSFPMNFIGLKLWHWLPDGRKTAFHFIGAMRRQHPAGCRNDLAGLFQILADRRIAPVVADVMPFSEVRPPHARI
jgi:NADPH:quinone reductase-like Zn-dependent oxidoreductase